jgi:hypothetical protein
MVSGFVRIFTAVGIVALAAVACVQGQTSSKYPKMAPLSEYLMERGAEIALAKSAAPAAISDKAEVMVLGAHGYETAVKGSNGFVCVVLRGWAAGNGDPDFWNPKLRAPICFNQAAISSQVASMKIRTGLVLDGASEEKVFEGVKDAVAKGKLPAPETGAMCYMLSKQGYLSERDGHWHPHLMFFVPLTEGATWGAGVEGSPVVAAGKVEEEKMTVFLVPVGKWSDGTLAE